MLIDHVSPPSSVITTPPTSTPTRQRSNPSATMLLARAPGGHNGTGRPHVSGEKERAKDSTSLHDSPTFVVRNSAAGRVPAYNSLGSPDTATSSTSRSSTPTRRQARPASLER